MLNFYLLEEILLKALPANVDHQKILIICFLDVRNIPMHEMNCFQTFQI